MSVKNRRKGREAALKILYQIEVGDTPFLEALQSVIDSGELPKNIQYFGELLSRGVEENLEFIDKAIGDRLNDWRLDRLAPVDRNLMRIAVFELFHCPEIPPAVTLNEAVELAKKYSTAESGKFVNGVLGRILEDSPKWNWTPQEAPAELEMEELAAPEPVEESEEVTVTAGSEEAQELERAGVWVLKNDA